MNFIRKVTDSKLLASIIDIPESLRNKKVEILIFPYKPKKARGLLGKYKNKNLRKIENKAWTKAVVDKYENS